MKEGYFNEAYIKPTFKRAVYTTICVFAGIATLLALGRSGGIIERFIKVGIDLWRDINQMPWILRIMFLLLPFMQVGAMHNILWKGAEQRDVYAKNAAWKIPLIPLSLPLSNGHAYFECQVDGCIGHLSITQIFQSDKMNCRISNETAKLLRERLKGKDRCFCNVCGVEHKDAKHVAVNPINLKDIVRQNFN